MCMFMPGLMKMQNSQANEINANEMFRASDVISFLEFSFYLVWTRMVDFLLQRDVNAVPE